MKRDDAIKIIQKPIYSNPENERKDIEYFLKKINWNKSDLDSYLNNGRISHLVYGSEKKTWQFFNKIFSFF